MLVKGSEALDLVLGFFGIADDVDGSVLRNQSGPRVDSVLMNMNIDSVR